MHAVIDTNVFVSGLLGSRTCRKIFSLFKEGEFSLDISEILLEELKFVIERPKLHILINEEERKEIMAFIKHRAIFIKPKGRLTICRDAKDNKILECALEAKSNCIISGDKDLLALKSFRDIPIVSPRKFLARLKK